MFKSAISRLLFNQCCCTALLNLAEVCLCLRVCTCVSEYKENLDISTTFDLFRDKSPRVMVCLFAAECFENHCPLCLCLLSINLQRQGEWKYKGGGKRGTETRRKQVMNTTKIFLVFSECWNKDQENRDVIAGLTLFNLLSQTQRLSWTKKWSWKKKGLLSTISQKSSWVMPTSALGTETAEATTTFGLACTFSVMLISVHS